MWRFALKAEQELADVLEKYQQQQSVIEALNKVSAVIEFDLNGHILTANDNFLQTMGYKLEDIQGKHHRIFVCPEDAASPDYTKFWQALNRGEFSTGRYRRQKRNGEAVWLEASYNPVLDEAGKPYKIIKFATDITSQVQIELDAKAQIKAINKVMAVIEFDTQGHILCANENFSKTMGYNEHEIIGQHHRMFCDEQYARSSEYQNFWNKLSQGESFSGTFHRIDKDGKDIWLEASYNPIIDPQGQVIKVIKYATDIGSNESNILLDNVIEDAANTINKISDGDLTAHMQDHLQKASGGLYEKNIKRITQALENMTDKLSTVIGRSVRASINFQNGTTNIHSSTVDLNSAIQSQAASLQQTNATMHHVKNGIKENSKYAHEASQVASQVLMETQNGAQVMNSTVTAMNAIQESSNKISEIVGLIDGIAFQTNLLALNAAVEAARAGEHGRGFAVVAGEVRSLAQKSADAAAEIKDLILETVSRVDQGAELATKSGKVLEEINKSVGSMEQMVKQIANASLVQSNGVQEIHQVISGIDQTFQENALRLEQTAETSSAIHQQASDMREDMAYFRISNNSNALISLQ
ncbi:methyl-accepting chemotaxis protein [uncultured Thiomicrorhabdus sp.]